MLKVATREFFLHLTITSKETLMVAVRSALGPALGNIVMCRFGSKLLKDDPHGLKPKFYWRYVDEVSILLSPLDHAEKFKEYLSSRYPYIKFFWKQEKDHRVSFLGINIFHKNEKFVIYVKQKKVFIGIYANFKSFICKIFKSGLIKQFLFQWFSLR